MINNTEKLVTKIFQKSLENSLKTKRLEKNCFLVNNQELDTFLRIIFNLCSENEFCFNIIREKIDFLSIEVLESLSIKTISIQVSFSYDITKEKENHKKRFEKYKSRNIYPIIGPDGVGKTTLLTLSIDLKRKDIIYKRFKKIIRRTVMYNLIYPINKFFLKRKLGKKPEKDQHDDTYYLLVLFVGIIHHLYLLLNSKLKKRTIFIDRFFNDYLLENISFLDKETVLRKNWKKLLKFIPTVFWMIHLDAKPEVILARKNELTKEDIEKYKDYNFNIYLEKPSFIYTYINTGLEIEECRYFLEHTFKLMEIK